MKLSTFHRVGGILILLLAIGELHADRIILKNGRAIDGTLIGQTREFIRVRSNGRVLRIRKKRIRRILYGNFKPAVRPAVKPKPKPTPKPPAVKPEPKPVPVKPTADAKQLRETAAKLRAAEERARLAEKRIQEAEEKLKQAHLRTKAAEEKHRRAAARASELESKVRSGNIFSRGDGSPSTMAYFIPGLGQWQRRENWQAGLTGGLFAFSAFTLYDANERWKRERTAYENLNSFGAPSPTVTSDPAAAFAYAQVFESRQANIDAQYSRTRNAFISLLLVYAWNYFDLSRPRTARSGKAGERSAYGQWRVDLWADAGGSSRSAFKDLGGSKRDEAGIRLFFRAKVF